MIIRIVKLTIREDSIGDFMDNFNEVKQLIRAFPGCQHLELLTDIADPRHLFTYSLWETEAQFKQYTDSDLFRDTWNKVKPLFAGRAEAWSLEKLQSISLSNNHPTS